jgi:hypothetical protein
MAVRLPITLTPDHGYVLLGLVAIPFHCFLQSFLVAKVRYRVFSEKYIEENLKEENEELKKNGREVIGKGCHPDNGLGRLGDKLPLSDWIDLQQAQRAHLNYLETLSLTQWLLAVAGYFHPLPASILAAIHLAGRQLYCSGFRSSPGARGPGFLIVSLTNLALLGLAVFGAVNLIRS